ncbi:hypothetical protein OG225_06125 [Nocardia sp. NBC_01377]|uniref:hypothetical protein n=1 Tax=Nocardia sp. NBC_01377 TaxID=2903595 RepID=UPI0032552D39
MRSYRPLFIAFVAITAVVVAVFVLTITRDSDHEQTAPSTPAASPAAVKPSPSESVLPPGTDLFGNRLEVPGIESGIAVPQMIAGRPDPGSPDYLSTPPAGLRWQRGWSGAAMPISSSDGPTTIRDGIATGFARTPQGAALAAADALARALAAPEPVWQQVVRDRYYGGGTPLLDRFARSRERTRDAGRYVVVPDGVRVRPGYRDDLAVVEFAARDDLGYRVATWPMAWIEGDWRVRVPADIETLWGPGTYVTNLAGFGSWKTVS